MDIIGLAKIRAERDTAITAYNNVSLSVLHDISNIPKIYEWFCCISSELCDFPPEGSNQFRQRFIAIIILLYCPGALFGDKMASGVRAGLSSVLKVKAPTIISDNVKNVMLYYKVYLDFKYHVDYLYADILARIAIHGLK